MNCRRCSDTGSLSKEIGGYLDCPYCDVAVERRDLEAWHKTVIKPQHLPPLDVLWLAVLRDRQINQGEKK